MKTTDIGTGGNPSRRRGPQVRQVTLGDVAAITMGQSPPGSAVSAQFGLPLLNGPTEFGLHHPLPAQFTAEPRKRAQLGDLLFCVRGSTTGRMNWADQEYAIGRGIAAIRHLNDPNLQPMVRGVIEANLQSLLAQATGSTFPNVSASLLANIPYPILGETEEAFIAHVLGSLDDKIELNCRMNETLEQMARALYKSWFVDFDPVHAKMEGRWQRGESLPGLPAELYDLFPDHLLPSKLGEIPEGWSIGTVGDLVTIVRDSENPAENPETMYSHFSIPAYDDEQRPKRELGSSIKSVKSSVQNDVVLLSKLNPHIERVWLVDVGPDETAVCSTEFLVLKAKPPIQRCYVYCLAVSPTFRQLLESLVTGTSKSHQRAPAKAILSLEVLLPAAPVIEAFESYAGRVLNRSLTSIKESDYLARQRDAVLPKLISGELRVHDTCGSFGLEEPESRSTHHIVSVG